MNTTTKTLNSSSSSEYSRTFQSEQLCNGLYVNVSKNHYLYTPRNKTVSCFAANTSSFPLCLQFVNASKGCLMDLCEEKIKTVSKIIMSMVHIANLHPSAMISSCTFLAISSVVARSAARPEVQTHLDVQHGL